MNALWPSAPPDLDTVCRMLAESLRRYGYEPATDHLFPYQMRTPDQPMKARHSDTVIWTPVYTTLGQALDRVLRKEHDDHQARPRP